MNPIHKSYTVDILPDIISMPLFFEGNRSTQFDKISSINEADGDSLTWFRPDFPGVSSIVENTKASVIICSKEYVVPDSRLHDICFVKVENPRLAFIRVVEKLFKKHIDYGIHATAYVDPEALIHPNSYIGPFSYIGKCEIGEGSVVHGHCYLYDNVIIGRNVTIHAGAAIGGDGFGYSRNEFRKLEKFPHIGGVIIEDEVEIGSNTCIDCGTIGNTIIRLGTKIDNLVHIAHNVVIGAHCAIIAQSMIGGSTVIGDYSWVAPSVAIRDGLKIGSNTTIGLGSVVVKSILDDEVWLGSPAQPITDFLKQQTVLKSLVNERNKA